MQNNEINMDNIDIDKFLESNIQFEDARLIPREDPPALSLLEVYASDVEPQECSNLIIILNSIANDKALSHLKRIRKINNKLQILLYIVGFKEPEGFNEVIKKFNLNPFIVSVPAVMPTDKTLWKIWSEYWPINWKLSSYHILSNDNKIDSEDQRQMEYYMKKAISIMKQYKSHNAAIIVNPNIQKIITWAIDDDSSVLSHACMNVINKASKYEIDNWEKDNVNDLERPYLCTGYTLYVVREPCLMCAMALLHSRFKKIVYCIMDEIGGGLGGFTRLHAQKTLNHYYTVYQLPMKEECKCKCIYIE